MKVGKEEMAGALAALELYLKRDHAADWREWERRVGVIAAALRAIPGVAVETYVPSIASHMPHAKVLWDQTRIRITVEAVLKALRESEPSIEVNPDSKTELILAVWTLLPGEEKIVANRLKAILKGAAS
jgi:L-seryl-tRNA(Ser) seleniumtransferase